MPMSGWDAAGTKFLSDAGYGNNEAGFWSWFWADMATTLKDCPNAIFEAWNEPQRWQRRRPHPLRLHDLPNNHVQRHPRNRLKPHHHDAVAHGLVPQRIWQQPSWRRPNRTKQSTQPTWSTLPTSTTTHQATYQLILGKRLRWTQNHNSKRALTAWA